MPCQVHGYDVGKNSHNDTLTALQNSKEVGLRCFAKDFSYKSHTRNLTRPITVEKPTFKNSGVSYQPKGQVQHSVSTHDDLTAYVPNNSLTRTQK